MKTFLTKFVALIKAIFVQLHLSVRVGITRADDAIAEEKASQDKEVDHE